MITFMYEKKGANNIMKIDEATKEAMSRASSADYSKTNGLTQAEVNELTERFKGMSQEEMELFVDIIPVELCLSRIHKELDKAKEFEAMIKSAMTSLR